MVIFLGLRYVQHEHHVNGCSFMHLNPTEQNGLGLGVPPSEIEDADEKADPPESLRPLLY
jgi:hypothetical protein